MSSVDKYFGQVYDRQTNNCLHLAARVWADETGQEFQGVFEFLHGKCSLSTARKFTKLEKPVSPCIVIFKGGEDLHVGIYLRGKILHFAEDGVQYQPLHVVSLGFLETVFYTC